MLADIELPHPVTYDDDYATRRIAQEAADMKFENSLARDYEDLPTDLSPEEKKNWKPLIHRNGWISSLRR